MCRLRNSVDVGSTDAGSVHPGGRFQMAVERFDLANAMDPRREADASGTEHPKELLYARRMSDRLSTFAPDASEALRLAVRCQHIRRWAIARTEYPMDRMGYRRWRTALAAFHAAEAEKLLQESGYDRETIARVQDLLQKRRLKKDVEVQILEDVACLVFVEHYLADFAGKHLEEKVEDILRKTWVKMSERGRAEAMSLEVPPHVRRLLERVVSRGIEE